MALSQSAFPGAPPILGEANGFWRRRASEAKDVWETAKAKSTAFSPAGFSEHLRCSRAHWSSRGLAQQARLGNRFDLMSWNLLTLFVEQYTVPGWKPR